MASGQGDIPALESGMSSGLLSSLSCPIRMTRRTFSYDENLDAPMQSPPSDMIVNMLWKDPVIPQNRFKTMAEEEDSCCKPLMFEVPAANKPRVPLVKAKATFLMNTLMNKQTQEDLRGFELQAGLTDTGYTPRKGLSAEETCFHRLPESTLPKLRMPSGDFKEDRLATSAQSTPCGTPTVTPSVSPQPSPSLTRRSWSNLCAVPAQAAPERSRSNPTLSMGGNEGSGGDRWSFFGTLQIVQKSPTDPGSESSPGFTLQSYFGLHKSTTMDAIKTQVNLKVEDPANFMPPKIEITGAETKRVPPRPHKLKPRDMNVLTPSGF